MSDSKKSTPTPAQDEWRRIDGERGRVVNDSVPTHDHRIEKDTTVSQQQPHSNPPAPPPKGKK